MFNSDKQRERASAKQKVRDRINAGFDRSKYKYIPEEKPLNYCDDNITQTVGIYVRVSTDDVRQTTSYELQKKYYEDFVQKHPNWKLYKIYADEGISGTSTTKREAFNEMIADAKAHKIDLIITKSVSRFARNVRDFLGAIRDLADLKPAVGVFFESEAIHSLNEDSQMALTFQSTMAEEESHTRSRSMESSLRKGVKQAYLGLVRCKDFLSLLTDSDDNMLTNIFEDNVRDFQGYNTVNTEIQDTLQNEDDQARFGILNNGITIVAKRITPTGDEIEVYDYQIVNGCQTSYVLFDNKEKLNDNSYVMLKLIEVTDDDVSDKVIYTTNRQTEVKSEAFIATKLFHKRLQDFYNSIDPMYRLYYERRSKQYDLNDNISKNKVITLTQQIQSYLAMFLNEPHSTHRYYGELLRAYDNKLFLDTDDYEPYFCSAYFSYYVDYQIIMGNLDKKYKRFKYHLICAMRTLISESSVVFGQARKQQKICKKLWEYIKDESAMKRILDAAVTCLESAFLKCTTVPISERHRSKEITLSMIDFAETQTKASANKSFLKKGDIVHCTVTSMNPHAVKVSIKTDDARNYGSIYISRIAEKNIKDIYDEISIGEIFQAQIINDDFYEKPWGWELSKIF